MGWRIVSGPHVGAWVTAQTEGAFDPNRSVAIGLERDGKLVAGTVYENWNGRSVVCHIAWERVTPTYMAAVYDYAYNVAGVDKIIGPISSNHTRALALVSKMGFLDTNPPLLKRGVFRKSNDKVVFIPKEDGDIIMREEPAP